MNKKIIVIADFFAEHVNGGGELNNEVLITILKQKGYLVTKIQSHLVTIDFLTKNNEAFYIVSNFINLSEPCRQMLTDMCYIIYEHDHKYIKSRNPATYKDFKAPSKEIINHTFYKNALAVLCQSSFHKEIVEKNTGLSNIINLSGNLWSLGQLEMLRDLSSGEKSEKCSIMDSPIPHKNTLDAMKYCSAKGKEYELIPGAPYIDFLKKLGENKTLVFFPKTPETLSRIIVEARMMGMSVITNQLVGATKEDWFGLKGSDLVDFMIDKREEIANLVIDFFNTEALQQNKEITIISTFHEGKDYLEPFLKDITKQTIFDKCELIFIDAASEGNEQKIIKKYMKQFKNIVYHRIEYKAPPTECINMAIKMSKGRFLTFGNIDDRRRDDCLEILYNDIVNNDEIDLVYGDSLQTDSVNETFKKNSANNKLAEHSVLAFSRENMIKCLPGPMPLWRKSIHDRCGLFDDENCNYADDWEMWLRAVNAGSKFKKVDDIVGLYYSGGRSQQEQNIEQRKEEARIFYQYSNIFGQNFVRFKPYFDQFV
tara:strand:- start:479 stop:2098 length:1620 start_codon:yes stop_codon:yes gene_type:complete